MSKWMKTICLGLCAIVLLNACVFAADMLPSNPWHDIGSDDFAETEKIPDNLKKPILTLSELGFLEAEGLRIDDEISYKAYSELINAVTNGTVTLPHSLKEKISYNDIIKSLVLLTGYGVEAEQRGGDAAAYNGVALQRDILSGFSGNFEDNATVGNAVLLVYNASKIDILEQISYGADSSYTTRKGYTVLSKYHDIYSSKGRITANHFTELDGKSTLPENQIKIDNDIYYIDDISPKSDLSLGISGEYYYRLAAKENDLHLIYFYSDDKLSKSVTLSPKDIVDFSSGCVLTAESANGRNSKYSISPTANVIRNNAYIGKKAHALTIDDFNFSTGSVTLIAAEKGGAYDLVVIRRYENYVVSSVNVKERTIYSKFGSMPIVFEDDETISKVLKTVDNKKITLDKLKEWTVVELGKNDDGDITDAIVTENTVSGVITQQSKDGYVIGDKTYECSDDYFAGDFSLALGAEVTVVLNLYGEIIAVKDFHLSEQEQYGYLIDAAVAGSAIDESIKFKIFTLNGKIIVFDGADRINLNNNSVKDKEQILQMLKAGKGEVQGSLIIYSLNGEGNVKSIKLPYDEWAETKNVSYYENPLKLSAYGAKRIWKSGFLCYKVSEGTFDPSSTVETDAYKEFYATQNTIFIGVPEASEQKHTDKGYGIKKFSDFSRDGLYTVTGYDINDKYEMGVVVVEDTAAFISDNDAQVALIGDISDALNSDGEKIKSIELAYNGSIADYPVAENATLYEWNYSTSADASAKIALEDIHKGDAVRVVWNSFGEVSVIARLLDITSPPNEFVNSRNMYGEKAYGHVKEKLGNIFVLEVENGGQKTDYLYKTSETAKFYLYNPARDMISIGSYDDILDGKTAYNASKVYLRCRDTGLQEVVIFLNN